MNDKQDQPKEGSGGGVFTGSQNNKKSKDWVGLIAVAIIMAIAAAIVFLSI